MTFDASEHRYIEKGKDFPFLGSARRIKENDSLVFIKEKTLQEPLGSVITFTLMHRKLQREIIKSIIALSRRKILKLVSILGSDLEQSNQSELQRACHTSKWDIISKSYFFFILTL